MKKLSLKKEAEIMRRLHYLISSGQGIMESLKFLELSYPTLKPVLVGIMDGQSLTKSIRLSNAKFSSLSLKVLEVSELTGTLASSLLILSEHLRHSYEIRSQLIGALIYPVIICVLCGGLMIFLLSYILPQIMPVFESLNIALPVTTRSLIFISNLFKDHTLLFLTAICFVAAFLVLIFKHIPGIKRLRRLIFLISFFRSFGIMFQSQIGVIQAISIIAEKENQPMKKILIKFNYHIQKGKSLSSFLRDNPKHFLKVSSQFIEVGESTGNLGKSSLELGQYLEYDFLNLINKLTKLFEPAVMILVGIMVGFISLSLISPLYELSRISSF